MSNTRFDESTFRFNRPLLYHLISGAAWEISYTDELASGEEIILHIENAPENDLDMLVEPFSIRNEGSAEIEAWKGGEPNDAEQHFEGDLTIGNANYAYPPDPTQTVDRITSDELDTTVADTQTLDDTLLEDDDGVFGGDSPEDRGLWRVIPPGESISAIIRNVSGGNNDYGLNGYVYEANLRADGIDSTEAASGY